jgi:hypothetical protein
MQVDEPEDCAWILILVSARFDDRQTCHVVGFDNDELALWQLDPRDGTIVVRGRVHAH